MSTSLINQAVTSFIVLLVGYFGYSSLAVPLIEGPRPTPEVAEVAVQTPTFESPAARFQSLIDPLFPAGSWERRTAKILKTDRLLLLLKDYRPLENNRLHIAPCTVVLLPEAGATAARTWVIQAIEGAIIEFDEGVEVRQGQLGKILSAYVPGTVQIRGMLPQGGEMVEISSRNMQFEGNRLWTPHELDFRVGNSFGSGRDLTVILNSSGLLNDSDPDTTRREAGRLPATVSSQLRSVELVEIERLHIDPSDQWGQSLDPQLREVPVDISCEGSLFVDVISGIGRLSKQVRISRRPVGRSLYSTGVRATGCDVWARESSCGKRSSPGSF